jgi:hypothetical protein
MMKFPRQLVVVLTLGAAFTFSATFARAACFQRLTMPDSHNTGEWRDLVDFAPSINPPQGATQFQRIADGRLDKINLDFYSVTFSKPSGTIEDFFVDVRKRFGLFARGENKENDFIPYRGAAGPDSLQTRYDALWKSSDPKGALMTFVLATLNSLAFAGTTQGLHVVGKNGDVVATCSSPTDFIFSTVTSERNSQHPVNGNRGFGIADNGDGTWTFYTKGADRETSGSTFDPRHPTQPMFSANFFARLQARPAIGPEADDTIFQFGNRFWVGFFSALEDYLNRIGLRVRDRTMNTKRYDYPL